MRAARRLPALAALIALSGCGGDDGSTSAPAAKPVGKETAGSVVQFADCDDWRAGTPAERRATVVAIRGQLTPTQSETAAGPLPDDRAYAILQKACSPDYAGSLRLYKLYARAQGFAPLAE